MTITVMGTVFVDIKGYGNNKINCDTKNIGNVEFVHGGVGRNVAEAIGRAGGKVEFLTSVDYSAEGEAVVSRLKEIDVRTDRIVKTNQGMGMWLAVLDGTGDLVASISQRPYMEKLERMIMEKGEEIVKNSAAVVIEFDLSEHVVQQVVAWAKQYNVPLYGIVGNLEVILKKPALINDLDLFIINQAEAEELLGATYPDADACKIAAKELTENGLKSAVVTMGADGSVFYDSRTDTYGFVPCEKVKVADTTGAGDSFFSGAVYGLASGFDLERAVKCGTQMAAWTISSKSNVDPDMQEKVKNSPLFATGAAVQ